MSFTILAGAAVTACGGPSHPATLSKAAVQSECTNVADVLSDGPDPGADPVGYAQAQVRPLERLKLADPRLRHAVHQLASAYRDYSEGASTARAVKVSKAEGELLAICPSGEGSQVLPGQAVP